MSIEKIRQLDQLDFYKQAAFAYLTCERLYPNYVYFSEHYNFGNPAVLREAIDYIYDNLFTHLPDKNKKQILLQKVKENTPNPDKSDTELASCALYACTSILESLDFLTERDSSKIDFLSAYGIDTVEMYIREIEHIDVNFEKHYNVEMNRGTMSYKTIDVNNMDENYLKKIYSHPLMEKELNVQAGIISFLNKSKVLDYGDIDTLLHLQENGKKGNLDL